MSNKSRRNRQRANKRKGLTEATQTETQDMRTLDSSMSANSSMSPDSTEPGVIRQLASTLMNRFQLAKLGSMRFGGLRDLYSVFGYENKLNAEKFMAKYIRQDITTRIIDAPPGATWSNPPKFESSATFQNSWDKLNKRYHLWNIMNRCDRLSRLGYYSLCMFGFNDNKVDKPLGDNVSSLLYIKPISSRMVKKIHFNTNPRDPRFGLPESYEINFDQPSSKVVTDDNITVESRGKVVVHHSRVVHIVENPLDDEVIGIPVIEKVYNLLDDLLKVSGGTPEMFWLGARQGMQADIDKEMTLDADDAEALSDELDEFQHQLRRIIRTRGVTLKTLESQVPNPQYVFDMLMALISGTTGIPRRILLGSEAGQLASEQDRANWAERIEERIALFAEPFILRPIVEKLQLVNLLPNENIEYKWPSAFRMSPLEEGQMMAQKARAVGNFSRQTGNQTPMQIITEEEAREILQLEGTISDADRFDPQRDSNIIPDDIAESEADKAAARDSDEDSNNNKGQQSEDNSESNTRGSKNG